MNTKTQAQKGFKTFLLTLVISLAVFSGLYYMINSGLGGNSQSEQIAKPTTNEPVEQMQPQTQQPKQNETLGDTSTRTEESVFGGMVEDKPDVPPKQVLAGADDASGTTEETPQATVPVTGFSTPTFGIVVSILALSLALYLLFIGPRNFALSSFEKRVIDDLD